MDYAAVFSIYFVQFFETRFLYQSIIFFFVALMYWRWFREKDDSFKVGGRALPGIKTPFYDIYGNLSCLPSFSEIRRSGFPIVTFIIGTVSGHGQLFKEFGIFSFKLPFQRNVVLIKPETVEALLSSNVLLEKAKTYSMLHPWLGTGLLTSHGSKWRSRRKLLTHSFHFDILKDFVPIFDEQAKFLVNILKSKAHEDWIDIRHPITLCSLDIICETTLGVRVGAQADSGIDYVEAVLRATHALMQRFYTPSMQFEILFQLSSIGRQFRKDVDCLHRFTKNVIRQKKSAMKLKNKLDQENQREDNGSNSKNKRKALMDLLLDVHMNQQDFTEDDIQEEIDTFAFEGHDTTSTGMCWALYLIGLYPEIQDKIQIELDHIFGDDRNTPVTVDDLREMHYLECVLKESQRLYPSVPFFGRRVREDTNLCGYYIEKGAYVYVNAFILHRNADVFPNPEKFDPDRFLPENCVNRNPFAFVPFSAGPRNCIGQRFAMMEEKTVISSVLRNFRVKSLEHRDIVLPAPEIVLRSAGPIKLKFTHRLPFI